MGVFRKYRSVTQNVQYLTARIALCRNSSFQRCILKIRACKQPISESQLSASPTEMSERLGLNLTASVPGPVCQVLLCLMSSTLFDENTV